MAKPVLVMLPGWGMHNGIWPEFAQALAGQYQVLAVDLPGHGNSDNLHPFELDSLVSWVIAQVPAENFSILGWSLGGMLAIAVANRYSQRVTQLILLATNPKFVADQTWPGVPATVLADFINQLQVDYLQTLQRFFALQVLGLPTAKRWLADIRQRLAGMPSPQPAALLGGLFVLQQADLRHALKGLDCPVVWICGDQDGLVPPGCAEAIKNLAPQLKVQVVAGAGHLLFLSHPQQLLSNLLVAT